VRKTMHHVKVNAQVEKTERGLKVWEVRVLDSEEDYPIFSMEDEIYKDKESLIKKIEEFVSGELEIHLITRRANK
jgi:PHD/YefM family antitoxin component YafN of YafNO toxin-antitoxin module